MILAFLLFILPIYYIWCYKPYKSLRDGLKDWVDESSDDI